MTSRGAMVVVVGALVGALTGCVSPPGLTPLPEGVEEATIDPSIALPEPGTEDVCIIDTWSADLPGLAAQMEADYYADTELNLLAADVAVDGDIQWIFEADHTFQWGGPATFTTYLADGAGLEIVLALQYGGVVTGTWAYDNPEQNRIVLGEIDTTLLSTTPTVTVNGMRMDDPSLLDAVIDAAPGPGAVDITCGGGVLVTQPVGSPFATEWFLAR